MAKTLIQKADAMAHVILTTFALTLYIQKGNALTVLIRKADAMVCIICTIFALTFCICKTCTALRRQMP